MITFAVMTHPEWWLVFPYGAAIKWQLVQGVTPKTAGAGATPSWEPCCRRGSRKNNIEMMINAL